MQESPQTSGRKKLNSPPASRRTDGQSVGALDARNARFLAFSISSKWSGGIEACVGCAAAFSSACRDETTDRLGWPHARDKRSTPLGYGTLPMPLISDGQDVLSNKLDDLLTCLKEPWRQPAFEWQQIVWELR
jgi:hypothetical protein